MKLSLHNLSKALSRIGNSRSTSTTTHTQLMLSRRAVAVGLLHFFLTPALSQSCAALSGCYAQTCWYGCSQTYGFAGGTTACSCGTVSYGGSGLYDTLEECELGICDQSTACTAAQYEQSAPTPLPTLTSRNGGPM